MAGNALQAVAAENVLKIARVSIFNDGMISIERAGDVGPNSSIRLKVPASNLDGVLSSVSWDGAIERVSHLKMADAFRSPASLHLDKGDIHYESILSAHIGLEARFVVDHEAIAEHAEMHGLIAGVSEDKELCIVNTSGVTKVKLTAIRSFSFADERVQQELVQTLSRKCATRAPDLREVEIAVTQSGHLSLHYNLSGVPWSTGYHIDLSHGKVHVKCFACIDNPTPEDWNCVELNIVAGMFAKVEVLETSSDGEYSDDIRCGIEIPIYLKQLTGKTHQILVGANSQVEALRNHVARLENKSASTISLVFAGKVLQNGMRLSDYHVSKESCIHVIQIDNRGERENTNSSTTGSTLKMDMVDQESLSWYPCPKAVSIPKGHSILLPYCNVELEGAEVTVFDEKKNKERLLQAIRMQNTSGKTLECGSVLVQRGATYLGETEMPTLRPFDDCFLTFAIMLKTAVSKVPTEHRREYTHVKIAEGSLQLSFLRRHKTTYVVTNKMSRDHAAYLLHTSKKDFDFASAENADVVDVDDNSEALTQQRLRFTIPKEGEKKVAVWETRKDDQHIRLDERNVGDLNIQTWTELFPTISADTLQGVQDMAQALVLESEKVKELLQSKHKLKEKEDRVTAIIRNINGSHRSKYENELHSTYQQTVQITTEIEDAKTEQERQRRSFKRALARLVYEGSVDARHKFNFRDKLGLNA